VTCSRNWEKKPLLFGFLAFFVFSTFAIAFLPLA